VLNIQTNKAGPVQSDKIHLQGFKGIVFETKFTYMR